jgi:hypothetical protein
MVKNGLSNRDEESQHELQTLAMPIINHTSLNTNNNNEKYKFIFFRKIYNIIIHEEINNNVTIASIYSHIVNDISISEWQSTLLYIIPYTISTIGIVYNVIKYIFIILHIDVVDKIGV